MTRQSRQGCHAVANCRPGRRQIGDHGASRNSDEAAGQACFERSGRKTGSTKCFGNSRDLAIENLSGHVRSDVTRGYPGTADRDDEVDATDDCGVESVADLHFVGGDGDCRIDEKTRFVQQFRDQWTDGVGVVAVGCAIVDDDDQSAAADVASSSMTPTVVSDPDAVAIWPKIGSIVC